MRDEISTSSPEQNTTITQSSVLKTKIHELIQEYNEFGIPEIPKKIRKNLGDRLILTWGSNAKGARSTQWRKERAHDVYLHVLNACPHLYLAFISIISPTTCLDPGFGKIVTELLQANEEMPVRLRLKPEVKEFFKSTAAVVGSTENPSYVKLIHSLFPKDHSHSLANGLSSRGQPDLLSPAKGPKTSSQPDQALLRHIRKRDTEGEFNEIARHDGTEERPSKRHRSGFEQISDALEPPGHGQYYSFSCMRRNMVENLPEPFRTGMMTSELWRKERESGGLEITNGLKMYLPVKPNEDTLLVLRLSYHEGFNIFDMFGLGDSDAPEPRKD